MTTLHIPNEPAFKKLIGWLKGLASTGRIGVVCTPQGAQFVVVQPEQLIELDSILSDPAFVSALEAGVSDAISGDVETVDADSSLDELTDERIVVDANTASSIETGVADILAGRFSCLGKNESLSELLDECEITHSCLDD